MLYICADDFFKQAAGIKRLSREEEIEFAGRMHKGDLEAKKALTDSYLPVLGACIKRWSFQKPSLEIIYRGISVLEESVISFDFEIDNPSFSKFLENKVRRMFTRYIADS